jgi:DNA primase
LSTEGKIRIVSELQSYLAAINDRVARALYVKQLSERIRLDESAILERLRDLSGPRAGPEPGVGIASGGDARAVDIHEPFERRIIAMMLQFPEIITEIIQNGILEAFSHSVLKSAGEAILRHRYEAVAQLPELLAGIEEGTLKETLVALAMTEESWTRSGCSAFLRRFMETRQKQLSGGSMQAAIEAAERERDEDEVMRLLSEKQKMAVRREKQKMSVLRKK